VTTVPCAPTTIPSGKFAGVEIAALSMAAAQASTLVEVEQQNSVAQPKPQASDAIESIRRRFETEAMIFLCGPAAERRCRLGSAPGWRRRRTWDEVRAHHEAGHALGHLLGRHIWALDILEDQSVRIQVSGFAAGSTWVGSTPEPPAERPHHTVAETDLHLATKACGALALLEPPPHWRASLRIAHRLRAEARALVDANWYLVMALAEELLRHRELNQQQIAGLLPAETRGSHWRSRDREGEGA
jgi:hypothetical protein